MLQIIMKGLQKGFDLALSLPFKANGNGKCIYINLELRGIFVFAVVNDFRTFNKPKAFFLAYHIITLESICDQINLLVLDMHPFELKIVIGLAK